MNLLEILRSRIDSLREGDYSLGIKAILQHIEVAGRHLARGQASTDEVEIIGALAGFLASAAPEIERYVEPRLTPDTKARPDLLLVSGTERLILEIKKARRFNSQMLLDGLGQVSRYMQISGISQAILFSLSIPNTGKAIRSEHASSGIDGKIIVISTEVSVT